MALDFSSEPFFDDYSEDKNFYRILFRPGHAVQARELTQLQTILQEQVRRHGDHIFKEGSMVIPGQIAYDLKLDYIQLANPNNIDLTPILRNLVGKEIVNAARVKAQVVTFTAEETVDDVVQPYTLYVKYTAADQNPNGTNVRRYTSGETLRPVDGTSGLTVVVSNPVIPGVPVVGFGCSATIQRGVYYINKNFVLVESQVIILDKYTNEPSYRVGLRLVEDIVFPEDDETLLDNAFGSPNFAAPGAARYKIDLVLSKIVLDEDAVTFEDEKGFIDLLRLKKGKVQFKIDRTVYAELEKTLARRTFDESGDYTLSPFGIQVKNYRNNIRGNWFGNEKFVQGDILEIPAANSTLYFVAIRSGISASTRPAFENFANVDNFVDGGVIWEYTQTPKFNNGVYTFTAGDTSFANFTLNDHIRLDGMLAYAIEEGKAYVKGFEIEKISTEFIPAFKSRNLPAGSSALAEYFGVTSLPAIVDSVTSDKQIKTSTIDLSMGSYVNVNNVAYAPNISTLPVFRLHSVTKTTASNSTVIGFARITGLDRQDTSGKFKVFLFDIKMNAGKNFKDVKSITAVSAAATNFSCDIIQTNGMTILQEPNETGLIWSLPDYAISTIAEASYSVVAPLTATAQGNPNATVVFTAPAGYSFESVRDLDNYILFDNSNGSIITTPSFTLASNILTVSGVTQGRSYTLLATLRKNASVSQGLRTRIDAQSFTLTTASAAQARVIDLRQAYAIRIVSVMMSTKLDSGSTDPFATISPSYTVNITERYNFDLAQDINALYLSKLVLRSGQEPPTGPIQIKYEFISSTESTQGDFFGVNSYTHANSNISYDEIAVVKDYILRDSLDFRPIQVQGGTFRPRFFPKYGTTGVFKYKHHLQRVDNISLSTTGNFVVGRGVPATSLNTIEPKIPSNSMKLATVLLEPYGFSKIDGSASAIVKRIDNKRYTMRDIGRLERRIEDLEYYTALSLTEVDTKNLKVTDSEGFDRFKNGFLVDSFEGQGVGNPASPDWNVSIDMSNKELRPFFNQRNIDLNENKNSSFANLPANEKYRLSGDLVTLPYSETTLIAQRLASKTENVNPYAVYTWKGIVEVNPFSDTWFSTQYRPDIIINDNSQYDAVVARANETGVLGTVWNAWQTVWSSERRISLSTQNIFSWNRRDITTETFATETTERRTGTTTFISSRVDSKVTDDRAVETRVVPYVRPRTIMFSGFGFKPTTALFAYFDNTLVNSFITPATRLEVVPVLKPDNVTRFPFAFDTNRNAGSDVSTNVARNLYHNNATGTPIIGSVSINSGSNILTGTGTKFTEQVIVGDFILLGDNRNYLVTAIANDNSLTISPSYTGLSLRDNAAKIISSRHTTNDVELAFTKGEVIYERNGNGNTAIVVGQETAGNKFYIYVLNIRGSGVFSTSASSYLEGEYTASSGDKPRVKFIARTDFDRLITSETGLVNGIFRIPNTPSVKFRTGKRELTFSDSSSSVPLARTREESTAGSAFYEATGLVEFRQRTILATRSAQVVSQQVSDTRTLVGTGQRVVADTGWYDPLAQTFMVQQDGGAFITSVDLFFATKDPKIPVRIEIRDVVNGYPGATVLPFSRVQKLSSEVNVDSSKGLAATRFTFPSPIFLQNGIEYAIAVLSDSNEYRCWISQTDTIDVVSGNRISSQPYNGVLFKSQNGTAWTPDQTQDLKFVINCAQFSRTPVKLELVPPAIAFGDLPFNPLQMVAGTRKCRVTHADHGMVPNEKVVLMSRRAFSGTTLNGIAYSEIFNVPLTILSAEADSYVVQFGGSNNALASGRFGGGSLAASENYEYSIAMLEIADIVPEGTDIDYSIKTVNHLDQVDEKTITPKDNLQFDDVRVYPSTVNFNSTQVQNGISIIATLKPHSTINTVSPVIDVGRAALTLVSNKIDNPTLDINDPDLDIVRISPTAGFEIGETKVLKLVDINGDGSLDTIVVNSTTAATLYKNMDDKLNPGDVLRFTYDNIADPVRNMIIVSKSEDDANNLYFTLEGFNGEFLMKTVAGQTVQVEWLSRFKSEFAPNNSSTLSKYVTKKVNLSRPSEMIKIMFDAIIPNDAEVEIYYKTGLNAQSDFIESRYLRAIPSSYSKNDSEFRAVEASVENIDPFDNMIVKLVLKSINKSQVPRIKNLRVIACA